MFMGSSSSLDSDSSLAGAPLSDEIASGLYAVYIYIYILGFQKSSEYTIGT
jgi:hypothetical protein